MEAAPVSHALTEYEPEYSGQLCRAVQQGQNFAYYLAAINSNLFSSPKLATPVEPELRGEGIENHYRSAPLDAKSADFEHLRISSELIANQQVNQLLLWQCMHPDPLAVKNDPSRIDDEILANCHWQTQNAFQKALKMPENEELSLSPNELAELIPQAHAALS
ncbi:VC2046/SO_2500 family protein [Alteromonas sp. ASW11-36]|uniref:VC2046/SO_2500 family protein n=1 Tax=Alteromonas arenosi TaxID=3055817 RepID=A0ABT7SYB9_9ALTE|nr:VC2046/SO_2500 family protein [Alteromonas sp. ASW11-36]MDM7861004.1 VC2046/SO_2500 family protein [Alteromonas sp. ASW11-36]